MLDGTDDETRDFIHANALALQIGVALLHAQAGCVVLDFGSAPRTSIGENATKIGTLLGSEKPARFTGRTQPGDPEHWQANRSAYKALTGERSQAGLEEGLRKTLDAWLA